MTDAERYEADAERYEAEIESMHRKIDTIMMANHRALLETLEEIKKEKIKEKAADTTMRQQFIHLWNSMHPIERDQAWTDLHPLLTLTQIEDIMDSLTEEQRDSLAEGWREDALE